MDIDVSKLREEGDLPVGTGLVIMDMTASIFALINALVANNVITKADVAAKAQERLLTLSGKLPPEAAARLTTLRALATALEGSADDD